jgi:hypothetical protein
VSRRIGLLVGVLSWCALVFAAHAQQPLPKTMLHVTFKLVAFGIAPDSFDAMPREVWRAGETHLRFEPPKDPASGTATIAVVAMPDVWQWDVASKRGRHSVDRSESKRVRFPVFVGESDAEIAAMEVGSESAWFDAHDAKSGGERTVGDVPCTLRVATIGEREVTLYLRKDGGQPYQVALFDGSRVFAVRYIARESDLPFDAKRFAPPSDVVFEDQ